MTSFNRGSTTEEVLSRINLSGKRILITGGTAGLGWETARSMSSAGAEIIITARDHAKYQTAASQILEQQANAQLQFVELSLDDLDSCRAGYCRSIDK